MKPEIKRILFALDLSEAARYTFDHAVSTAMHHGAVILILHVVESLAPGTEERVAASFGKELYAELKSRKSQTARDILMNKKVEAVSARDALKRMCQEASSPGAEQSSIIEDIVIGEGDVAEEVLSLARQKACDLIVMGMRRRARFTRTFAGSVVRNVLGRTDIPVMIIPPTPKRPRG